MKNNTGKWLIWGGILVVLVSEVLFLMAGKGRNEEAVKERDMTSRLPKLKTVPFAATEKRSSPEVIADAPKPNDTAAVAPENPVVAEDPLSIDALRRRVQPTGAIVNEALLKFKSLAAYRAFLNRAAASGLLVKGQLDDLLTARVGFDTLERLQAELRNHAADHADASANYLVAVPRLPPPDGRAPAGNAPFGETVFSSMGIDSNVDRSQWGAGVKVAVVDSGIGEHPTFRNGQVTHVDLVNDGKPVNGHGTAIASLIAGSMAGAQGVAPGVEIIDVRVAGGDGGSDSFLLAQGVNAAVKQGADVINVSMGSYGDAPVVQEAVQRALDQGIIVVAAVGNEQASVKAWPAAYEGVVSVSSVDARGQLAYFSNTGNPTISAPGVGIPSAYYIENKPFNAVGSGTSQSTALVSGAVAAILSHGGNVMLTLRRNAQTLQIPAQAVGAGMVRLPVW